jgi:secreted Zn-dependent insulinase-like peptidase
MTTNNQNLSTDITQPSPCNTKIFNEIIKSENDDRLYRGVLLDNGLKVMLISDKNTNKSAAALSVNVGSLSDPFHVQGKLFKKSS